MTKEHTYKYNEKEAKRKKRKEKGKEQNNFCILIRSGSHFFRDKIIREKDYITFAYPSS